MCVCLVSVLYYVLYSMYVDHHSTALCSWLVLVPESSYFQIYGHL